jgi:hypothetical protein
MVRLVLVILGGAMAGLLLALGLSVVVLAVSVHGYWPAGSGPVEPSEKATALAKSISEAMNCSAAAAIILIPAGVALVWRWERRRDPRQP